MDCSYLHPFHMALPGWVLYVLECPPQTYAPRVKFPPPDWPDGNAHACKPKKEGLLLLLLLQIRASERCLKRCCCRHLDGGACQMALPLVVDPLHFLSIFFLSLLLSLVLPNKRAHIMRRSVWTSLLRSVTFKIFRQKFKFDLQKLEFFSTPSKTRHRASSRSKKAAKKNRIKSSQDRIVLQTSRKPAVARR